MSKVYKYGDNINTDVIYPGAYLHDPGAESFRAHCLENLDPGFHKTVEPGDFIVAGSNFGCGSSREHAPAAIKECGIKCVIAKSFARIFYRNAINIGLPILECPQAVDNTAFGDKLEVDFVSGKITNLTRGGSYIAEPFPEFIREIFAKGGFLPYLSGKQSDC